MIRRARGVNINPVLEANRTNIRNPNLFGIFDYSRNWRLTAASPRNPVGNGFIIQHVQRTHQIQVWNPAPAPLPGPVVVPAAGAWSAHLTTNQLENYVGNHLLLVGWENYWECWRVRNGVIANFNNNNAMPHPHDVFQTPLFVPQNTILPIPIPTPIYSRGRFNYIANAYYIETDDNLAAFGFAQHNNSPTGILPCLAAAGLYLGELGGRVKSSRNVINLRVSVEWGEDGETRFI